LKNHKGNPGERANNRELKTGGIGTADPWGLLMPKPFSTDFKRGI
jgi:hypothetical protein